jgi:L,D-peptidoglycan transpeptidase YkuD (ErfK/YbiS/YcfS/YnhG family)
MKYIAKELPKSFALKTGKVKRGLSRLSATRMPRQGQADAVWFGRFHAGPVVIPCALGRTGITRDKREGDHATPAGAFRLLSGFFRVDRGARPPSLVPMRPIRPCDGWCDDPLSAVYNRWVRLPSAARHEKLWRADGLYDLVLVIDFNIRPRHKFKGSAIFLHCAGPGYAPTEGCVALRPADLRRLLPRLSRQVTLTIR